MEVAEIRQQMEVMEASEAEVAEEIQIMEAKEETEERMEAEAEVEGPTTEVLEVEVLKGHTEEMVDTEAEVIPPNMRLKMEVQVLTPLGWICRLQGLEQVDPHIGHLDSRVEEAVGATEAMEAMGHPVVVVAGAVASEPKEETGATVAEAEADTAVQVEKEVATEAEAEVDTEKPLHLPEMIAFMVIRVRDMEAEQEGHLTGMIPKSHWEEPMVAS